MVIKQSTHQIAVTRNYIIIIDTAFTMEYYRIMIPGAPAKPQSPYNQVWFVPRAQLNDGKEEIATAWAKYVEIPRECVHFFANYDDDNDDVTLHLLHASGHDVSEWNRRWDASWPTFDDWVSAPFHGSPPGVYDQQGFGKYVVNAQTGEIKSSKYQLSDRFWGIALPTYNGIQETSPPEFANFWVNFTGYISEITPRRLVKLYEHHEFREVPIEDLPRWKEAGVMRWSPGDMEVKDFWAAPRGTCVTTTVYFPKLGQNNELEGYLVAMVSTPEYSEFWIWQAGNLAAGPVAKLRHPEVKFAFPLHAAWIPEIAPRTSTYKVDLRSDLNVYDPKYSFLPGWIKDIFENDIYPAFE